MNNKKSSKTETKNQDGVEVLYQKMGNRWFAFSLVGDEVYVGSITQSEIEVPAEIAELDHGNETAA